MIFPSIQSITLDELAATNLETLAYSTFYRIDYGPLPWYNIQSVTILTLDELAIMEINDLFVMDLDPDGSDEPDPDEPDPPIVGLDPAATYNTTAPLTAQPTVVLNWPMLVNATNYVVEVNGAVQYQGNGRMFRFNPSKRLLIDTGMIPVQVTARTATGRIIAEFSYLAGRRSDIERVQIAWTIL